ncbi:TlpA disulfide reductase family protein [Spirillospora sp. NPDC049024]
MKKLIVVGAVLLLAGCGGGGATTAAEPGGSAAGSPSAAASGAAGERVPAPLRFEGETLDGKPFDGASLAGRPVVFWFWAPWCPNCLAEGPDVAEAAAKYGDKVSFVGIGGLEKDAGKLKGFVSRTGTRDLVQLDDRTGEMYSHFGVTTQSSYVFMAPDGTKSKASGPLDGAALRRHVDALLG